MRTLTRQILGLLLALLGALLAPAARSQYTSDIDIFATPGAQTDAPNVLFIIDNTANWSPMFQREMRAIATLNHPHICALYDVGRGAASKVSGAPGAQQCTTRAVSGRASRTPVRVSRATDRSTWRTVPQPEAVGGTDLVDSRPAGRRKLDKALRGLNRAR